MTGEHDVEPLSPRERVRVRASGPRIRSASMFGAHRPSLARTLRRESTDAETLLWHQLRNRSLAGLKFRRQQILGSYVLDFICADHAFAIELDGSQHFEPEQEASDQQRTASFNSRGVRVLRFTNREVLTEIPAVLDSILGAISREGAPPSP